MYKIDRCRSVRVRVSASVQNIPCLVGRLWSEPRVVGRLGSGVRVSASFDIFALTAMEHVVGGQWIIIRGDMSIVLRECPGEMSHTRHTNGGKRGLVQLQNDGTLSPGLWQMSRDWHNGRTLVFDRRTFPVLRSICSWRVTTYVGKPSAVGQPTRPTQLFIHSG